MATREDKIKAIRDEIGGDYTVSMVDAVARSCGDDKQKILEFFRASVGGDQVNASFQEVVDFLRNAMPIYGAPDSLYEDCVRRANNDMSVAMDLLIEARNNMHSDPHSSSRPIPQQHAPAAAPIVSPPVYNPPAAQQQQQQQQKPAPVSKPLPSPEKPVSKPLPSPVVAAPVVSKPLPSPAPDPAPVPDPSPAKAVPVSIDGVPSKPSLAEEAKKSEADFHETVKSQEKEAEERERRMKESDERVAELKAEEERLKARIKSKDVSPEEVEKTEEQLHRCEMERSVLQSKIDNTIPGYMVGRVPTDECEISVTVTNIEIGFTWKIADRIEVSAKDWIGLYIHDRQYSNKYEQYIYLGGKREGSASFTAPTIGYFDLRYYPNKGYVERSRSEPFLVGPEMAVEAKLQGRRKIEVTWDRGSEQAGDWMALYPVSTYSNYKYIQQLPASAANSDGIVTFDAPRAPGKYEIRYFFTAKRNATGYAYSGRSKPIEIPNEDSLSVEQTHPIVKVRWATFSQEPNTSDWVGLYDSSDDKAERLGWEYLSKKGLMDSIGDHGVAEIEVKKLMCLAPEATLPEGSDKWEVRLFNSAPNQPYLRAPFLKPK